MQPRFEGDVRKYINDICEWADTQRGPMETITVDVNLTVFGVVGKKPELAAVSNRPISPRPEVNMGVYRHILERKIEALEAENKREKKRVKKLERRFAKELAKDEERYWARYGQNL